MSKIRKVPVTQEVWVNSRGAASVYTAVYFQKVLLLYGCIFSEGEPSENIQPSTSKFTDIPWGSPQCGREVDLA